MFIIVHNCAIYFTTFLILCFDCVFNKFGFRCFVIVRHLFLHNSIFHVLDAFLFICKSLYTSLLDEIHHISSGLVWLPPLGQPHWGCTLQVPGRHWRGPTLGNRIGLSTNPSPPSRWFNTRTSPALDQRAVTRTRGA